MKFVTFVRAPFSPDGEKARMRGYRRAHFPLTPTLSPSGARGATMGFSLVESLVIISIISILASLSLVALPAARAHQQLISDTELIQSLLLDSKERALNQVRPEGCLRDDSNPESADRAACSDVGIIFEGGKVMQFANIAGGTEEDPDYVYSGDTEHPIVEHQLLTSVVEEEEGGVRQILFRSVPPSVETYKDGAVMDPRDTAHITLKASNGELRKLAVSQFGTLDIVNDYAK